MHKKYKKKVFFTIIYIYNPLLEILIIKRVNFFSFIKKIK